MDGRLNGLDFHNGFAGVAAGGRDAQGAGERLFQIAPGIARASLEGKELLPELREPLGSLVRRRDHPHLGRSVFLWPWRSVVHLIPQLSRQQMNCFALDPLQGTQAHVEAIGRLLLCEAQHKSQVEHLVLAAQPAVRFALGAQGQALDQSGER